MAENKDNKTVAKTVKTKPAPKKLTTEAIKVMIAEEAYVYRRKQELFEAAKQINSELMVLEEHREKSMISSYGFKAEGDGMDKINYGGFKNPQNISRIAQLEKDFGGFGDEATADVQAENQATNIPSNINADMPANEVSASTNSPANNPASIDTTKINEKTELETLKAENKALLEKISMLTQK